MSELRVEPLCAAMTFRSVVVDLGVAVVGGDPDRLVVLGDVRDREVRVVPARQVRDEAEATRYLQIWRGL